MDPNAIYELTGSCRSGTAPILIVKYTTTPGGLLTPNGQALDCSKLRAIQGQPVVINWNVTNNVTCSPRIGVWNIIVPNIGGTPATRSPSPAPPGSACITCIVGDLVNTITSTCSEDPETGIWYWSSFDNVQELCYWSEASGITYPLFYSTPDLTYDFEGSEAADCSKAAKVKGQQVTLRVKVDPTTDPSVSCTPTESTYTFTMPNF